MKHYLPILLAGVLLTGCGAKEISHPDPVPNQDPPIQAVPAGLTLELEHQVYDPALEHYTYMVTNGTEDTVCLGEAYTLQKEEGDQWTDLTPSDGAAFTAQAYILEPGDSLAMTCSFDRFREEPTTGNYRLVKEAQVETGDEDALVLLQAEFSLGKSSYTEDAPYGIPPLEALPEVYPIAEAKRDGCMTISDCGIYGKKELMAFLQKVSMNIPCQLRTVQEFNEGTPVVTDLRFEDGKFLYRIRSGGNISDHYFSYLVTDGKSVCLSNGRDWDASEKFQSELVYLLPEGTDGLDQEADLVEEMTNTRLETHGPSYTSWSADGLYSASVTETVGKLLMTSPERQEAFTITDQKGNAAAIRSMSWDPDDLLIIYMEQGARAFNPVEWTLH